MDMSDVKCTICGKTIADGIGVYRNNPKGEPAIWRCEDHLDNVADPEVKRIVDLIADANSPMTGEMPRYPGPR